MAIVAAVRPSFVVVIVVATTAGTAALLCLYDARSDGRFDIAVRGSGFGLRNGLYFVGCGCCQLRWAFDRQGLRVLQ